MKYQLQIRGSGYWDDFDPDLGPRVRTWRPAMNKGGDLARLPHDSDAVSSTYAHLEDAENNLEHLLSRGVNEADLRIVKNPRVRSAR